MLIFKGHTIAFSGTGAAMLGIANNPNLSLPEVKFGFNTDLSPAVLTAATYVHPKEQAESSEGERTPGFSVFVCFG